MKSSVHFIGIGGIGMNALARWFLAKNWAISGSDLDVAPMDLKKARVDVKIGHKRGNVPVGARLVAYTNAARPDNPELLEARRRGIPVRSYPEIVGELTDMYRTLAVAGAHGKSTTTALLACILETAKFDPTAIVGTRLREFNNTGFRDGGGQHLVLEADEYRGAFLHYSPTLAIITNIDNEHLDYYSDLADIKKTFLKFIGRIAKGGTLVVNRDNYHLTSLAPAIRRIATKNRLRVIWYSLRDPLARRIRRAIRIPGAHNVSNALAALRAAESLGVPHVVALRAIHAYRGAWRRLELKGRFQVPGSRLHVPVYDDYGHHPTEIKATLQALREKYPKQKILCVFQPHHAERLAKLFKEFQVAFDRADMTLILPVYHVAGREKPVTGTYRTSEELARAIQKRQPKKLLFYLDNPNNLKKAIFALLKPITFHLSPHFHPLSPIIVMMGAGNIADFTNQLISSKILNRHR